MGAAFWSRLGKASAADVVEPGCPPDLQPGEVAFGAVDGNWLVRIRPDGTVTFDGAYKPEVAVRVFWEALAAHHPNVSLKEQRELDPDETVRGLLFQTLQTVLLHVGRADLHNEAMQLRAQTPDATEYDRFRATLAHANLESIVHQTIEFARGLVQQEARRERGQN